MSHTLRVEIDEGHPYITVTCSGDDSCPTLEDVAGTCWFVHAIEEQGIDMLQMSMVLDVELSANGYFFDDPIKAKVLALKDEP